MLNEATYDDYEMNPMEDKEGEVSMMEGQAVSDADAAAPAEAPAPAAS